MNIIDRLKDAFMSAGINQITRACYNVNIMFHGEKKMSQAKTLSRKELEVLLAVVAQHRHALRNRVMLLMTHLAGLRVGEVAALRIHQVVSPDRQVLKEIRLETSQTKTGKARTVFVSERLRKELTAYIRSLDSKRSTDFPLFYTQKRAGFNANTLCQHFLTMYGWAGLVGASSHSGRRTFITNLAGKGVGVRVLASLAGHASIQTTQRYIEINDEMKRRAVELV